MLLKKNSELAINRNRYRPTRLDLHESGTVGQGLKRASTAIGFGFLIFDLEYLIRVQSSEPLHAKMKPTSCIFGLLFACAQNAIFFAEPCSKNSGGTSIVLWIAA
jgi:hypothetical protein